jgi:hypothetical protein
MNANKFKSGFLALLLLVSVAFVGVGNVAAAGDVTVDVTYTDPGGTDVALENATVEIMDGSGNVVETAETGTDGTVSFASVSDGDYTVEATDPYGNTVSQTVTVSGSAVSASLNFSKPYTDIEFTAEHIDDGSAVEGVPVELVDVANDTVVETAETDAEGRVHFSEGYDATVEYDVVVAPAGENYETTTVSLSFSDYSEYDTTFATGTVTPYQTISFQFVDDDGNAVERAYVDQYEGTDTSGTLMDTYYADSNGETSVQVSYGTETTFEAEDERGDFKTASQTVTVDGDTTYEIQFQPTDADATTSFSTVDDTTDSDSTGGGGGLPSGENTPLIVGGMIAVLAILGFAYVQD